MKYTLSDGRNIIIPDNEIKNNMEVLHITEKEAIEMWLDDNDFTINEELEALDSKAKKVKIYHGASAEKDKNKENKPRTVKISDEKHILFVALSNFLKENYGENAEIVKENKLFQIKINERIFKIDVIEQRVKKN